jgi:hypothetical protein
MPEQTMTAIRTFGLLLLMGCTSGSAVNPVCTWDACLTTPGSGACECLSARLRACGEGTCSRELIPTSAETARLQTTIKRGARRETALAFQTLSVLDGGDLEDVMRALSSLAGDDPRMLLEQFDANGWEPARIERLVRMMPLETVDRPAETLRLIRQRLASLRGVQDMRLQRVRDVAIAALEKYALQVSSSNSISTPRQSGI